MSATVSLSDAKASAAFDRYAKACAQLRETRSPSDLAKARRECRRFLAAFLSPEERRQVEAASTLGHRRRQ